MILLGLMLIFLCWGSFLNVVGYRLVRGQSIVSPRSHCPHCRHALRWHENIPIVSWLILRGRCSACAHPISILYPFIEVFTALSLTALWYVCPSQYFPAYFIFFSALIVNMRSDIETMLISRFTTLFVIPVGIVASLTHGLFIEPISCLMGMAIGYLSLYTISWIFMKLTGKEGIGEGDFDLLALIGTFVGPWYCWQVLWFGSITGSIYGITLMYTRGASKSQRIPFGPFLSIGAIALVLIHFYAPWLLVLASIS